LGKKVHRQSSPGISGRRRRIFSLIVVLLPFLFFVLLELSLRVLQYGPDLSLFTKIQSAGKAYYTMNRSVKNRYFSQVNFVPTISPDQFLVSKPPGTFRIFCLGGSTTVGYPYWYNGAFSSFLRDRLKSIFPDRPVEIINVGMTATNSFTVLDLSGELMKYEPDLLIVYDGHNEFYGALGVASNEYGSPERWITLLRLRAVHLRTVQLVSNIVSGVLKMLGKEPVEYSNRATTMERVARGRSIPYGSDVYVKCLDVFRQNLKDLVSQCQQRGIPVFLGTQVSNLRDQAPFISNHSSGIPEQQRLQFEQLYRTGLDLQSKGLADSAMGLFRSAIALDSLHADAHYRLAQCLDAAGRRREAYPEYMRARDFDELRFRTDSRFNNLIRSMENGDNCRVADVERVFASLSQDSLIGHNLVSEHLHPTSRGQFLIAREYARLMRSRGILAATDEWSKRDTVSDDALWSGRHVTDVDEFAATRITQILTSGWPFKVHSSTIPPVQEVDTLRFIADQFAQDGIGWRTEHARAAEYYVGRGDLTNAEKEYTTIINQLPFDVAPYLRLGQLYFGQQAFSKAEGILFASLQIERTSVAYRALGDISLQKRKLENALHYYEELARFPTDPAVAPENAYMRALAYLLAEKPDRAMSILELTVERYPSYRPARELLGRVRQGTRAGPGK